MIILISQKIITDKYGTELDATEHSYIQYFKKIFFNPTVIPILNDIDNAEKLTTICRPDLIVLAGGNNVNPLDANQRDTVNDLVPRRDRVEMYLIEYAIKNSINLLGICRGFQILNVFLGGTIHYFIRNHPPGKEHFVLYNAKQYTVNSYHDHAVFTDDLSPRLTPIAYCNDIIEAAYVNDKTFKALGVQWHPEREVSGNELFCILIDKIFGIKCIKECDESDHFSRRNGDQTR